MSSHRKRIMGCEVNIEHLSITLSRETDRWGDVCLTIGWWVPGQWKELSGWIQIGTTYYDGRWRYARLGPFSFSCGPY